MEECSAPSHRGGVFWCLLFVFVFWFVQGMFNRFFQGIATYVFHIALRLLLGVVELWFFVRHFQKGSWTNVIHFRNFKAALAASAGLLPLMLFFALQAATGARAFASVPLQMILIDLFFSQLAVGFWEEMTCRAILLEGYFSFEERTWQRRMYYAMLSFLIFGLGHLFEADSSMILFRTLVTGALGVVFTASYLHSHNILVPMLVHYIYDIFAHIPGYVAEWDRSNFLTQWDSWYGYGPLFPFLIGIAFLVAVVYIIKEPAYEAERKDETI